MYQLESHQLESTKFKSSKLKSSKASHLILILFSWLICSTTSAADERIQSIINHPDRPAKDRLKDSTRKPESILPFTQIKQGNQVLELGAGSGYTTELLAHLVGEQGRVFAQGLAHARVANDRLPQVVALRRHLLFELEEVLTEQKAPHGSLDSAVIFFALHDFYLNPRMDKQAILKTIYQFLKPGGSLIILDNAADADAGTSVNRRLHRIGENFVIAELEKVGFKVESKSDALRNPDDDHTKRWQTFNGMQDRFAIRFIKPK